MSLPTLSISEELTMSRLRITLESFVLKTPYQFLGSFLKFHAFFRTVILKGEVLGKVDHFYWKKEYQARGAPHFHVLLWIRDAPVYRCR